MNDKAARKVGLWACRFGACWDAFFVTTTLWAYSQPPVTPLPWTFWAVLVCFCILIPCWIFQAWRHYNYYLAKDKESAPPTDWPDVVKQ